MWNWIRRQAAAMTTGADETVPVPAPRIEPPRVRPATVTAKYAPLHRYLEDRYADMVVLSFGQVESLLGFALPERARTTLEWWVAGAGPEDPTSCSAAWILAGRSARPNLLAQNVAFERA